MEKKSPQGESGKIVKKQREETSDPPGTEEWNSLGVLPRTYNLKKISPLGTFEQPGE